MKAAYVFTVASILLFSFPFHNFNISFNNSGLENSANCDINYIKISKFPKYINAQEVKSVLGELEISYTEVLGDINFPKAVNRICFYAKKNGMRSLIATIDKNGIHNNDNSNLFPFGFNPNSDFVKNHFIGFSVECISNPFILYAIAKDTNGQLYKTDRIMILDIDLSNRKIILYEPKMQ